MYCELSSNSVKNSTEYEYLSDIVSILGCVSNLCTELDNMYFISRQWCILLYDMR